MALSEVRFKIGKESFTLKATNKRLYDVLEDLGCDNKLLSLLDMIDKLDMNAIFTLFKHFSGDERSVEELMDLDITIMKLAEHVSKSLTMALGNSKK
jgi:histidyl-tRNA synthetase